MQALLDLCYYLKYQKFVKKVECWVEDINPQEFQDVLTWASQAP
jgi:hypothetical protein